MTHMPDATAWIEALRNSQQRLTGLLQPLTDEQVRRQSYADNWSIAQVASHLGSQAEIFSLFLDAGRSGTPAPSTDAFPPIWQRWDALAPMDQVTDSLAANDEFIAHVDEIPDAERSSFALSIFGMDLDLAGLLALRVAEHAVHTWDIEVILDPSATVAPDTVDLVIDNIAMTANRAGKPATGTDAGTGASTGPWTIHTTEPSKQFRLTADGEHVNLAEDDEPATDATVQMPAEAFIRLVYGRLDPDHTPAGIDDATLAELRAMFTGV
jgi:uncharacterized protein (TIGR03083 family)